MIYKSLCPNQDQSNAEFSTWNIFWQNVSGVFLTMKSNTFQECGISETHVIECDYAALLDSGCLILQTCGAFGAEANSSSINDLSMWKRFIFYHFSPIPVTHLSTT